MACTIAGKPEHPGTTRKTCMKLYYKTHECDGLGLEKLWSLLFADKFSGFAKVDHDFIQVDAVTSWGWTMSDVHMHVFPNKEVLERRKKPGGILWILHWSCLTPHPRLISREKCQKAWNIWQMIWIHCWCEVRWSGLKKTSYWLKHSFSREHWKLTFNFATFM